MQIQIFIYILLNLKVDSLSYLFALTGKFDTLEQISSVKIIFFPCLPGQ